VLTPEVLHQPVLLGECLELLALAPGYAVVDGTLGDGGHAEAILEAIAPDGRLLGIDQDTAALEVARQRLARFGSRASLVHASFRRLRDVLASHGFGGADAVLLDLGVSSRQLDLADRGFRFGDAASGADVPLDMRMNRETGPTAADLLARTSAEELTGWFRDYGELPGSARLAATIVETRREQPLRTAADLLRVIDQARVGRGRKHHPATLVFQALRIAVNDELGALEEGLEAAIAGLRPGGRLCVIAYHSLEDRAVKRLFQREERGCVCPPRDPVCTCGRLPRLRRVTRRPQRPSEQEIATNPRARSARLRAAERLPEAA